MDWSQIRSAAIVSLFAVVTILGFVAAPVSAIDTGNTTDSDETTIDDTPTDTETDDTAPTTDSQDGDEDPVVGCTDITGLVHEELPYDQVIWVDDLPEDAQPSEVPWNLLTPRAVGSIGSGAAPNQCDVADPNDPPYDPTEDDVDPDGDADVAQETEDGTTLLIVNGTLNRSSEGPGGETTLEFDAGEDGEVDPTVSLNDGEKDYGVDPGIQYWSNGTTYTETDVTVIGVTGGGEVDCVGEECTLDARGAPGLVDEPSAPSPSTDNLGDATDDPVNDATSGLSDGGATTDTTSNDDPNDAATDASVADESDDSDSDTSSSNDAAENDGTTDGSDDSASTDATGEPTETDDESDAGVVAAQDQPDSDDMSGSPIPGAGGLGAMALFGMTLIGSRLR